MIAEIHKLLANPLTGPDIEARSFALIDGEVPDRCGFPANQWEIVRRMIHTTADISLAKEVRFSPDAITSGISALACGAAIYTDSNMIRSGLSQARLRTVNPAYDPTRISCHVADDDVAVLAHTHGLPRSLFAIRKATHMLDGGIIVFGNAPVALLELNRMILEDGVRPALVIGMPVGFVHVVESKQELATLGVPYIGITGRRGGSTLAVATLHALCSLASQDALATKGGDIN